MKIVYKGPSPSVMIGLGDRGYITAVNGEPFDVDDDLGAALLEQDIYEPVKKSKAVPAASKEAAVPQEDEV
jgi:S1-C subfamily serine protease